MFFVKKNKYTTPELDEEITQKWFWVYNYISFDELMLTVQRDFLEILSSINYVFGIATIGLWIFWFLTGNFIWLVWCLCIVYFTIFVTLTFKLIRRSYIFLQISNVVYTKKGIILWDILYTYSDDTNLEKRLIEYERDFDEFLSKPSKLKQVILSRRAKILDKTHQNNGALIEKMWRIWGGWDEWAQLMLMAWIMHIIYVWLLYLFYYLGLLFGKIIFWPISWGLKIILYFKENTEIKMKQQVEAIDDALWKMYKTEQIIAKKLQEFNNWEISSIQNFVEKNFGLFYSNMLYVLQEKKKLLELISQSNYSEFIDFLLLENYVKKQYNKPINEMIPLLETSRNRILRGIEELDVSKTDDKTIRWNIAKKKITLTHQLDIVEAYKWKLTKARI